MAKETPPPFKIHRGIPIPSQKKGRTLPPIYHLLEVLQIGECLDAPVPETYKGAAYWSDIQRLEVSTGKRFRTRGYPGFRRIWRTE